MTMTNEQLLSLLSEIEERLRIAAFLTREQQGSLALANELRSRIEREEKLTAPTGEGATGYNAGVYIQVYYDVIGVVERERLQKLEDTPARRKNHAKESTWQSQLVGGLVHRIMNLRLMLAANRRREEKLVEAAQNISAKLDSPTATVTGIDASELRDALAPYKEGEGK